MLQELINIDYLFKIQEEGFSFVVFLYNTKISVVFPDTLSVNI
jgi:hypothetical protein